MRKTSLLLAALLAVAGIYVMLWPVFTGQRLQADTDEAVQSFLEERKPEQQYPELLAALQEYNRQLYAEKQCNLTDLEACEEPAADLTTYGIEDEIIGVLEIPAMELTMPVYLGASDAHLAAGAAVLGNTSAPIGGDNTNCVIAGHRGWRGADYFRHIDRLQVGDTVTLTNAWNSGWGYVWGTYGQVLTPELLQYKLTQYPDGVGKYAVFIRANWLGRHTADCVGLIKGYGWLSTDTMTIDYGTHGMPDIGANEMFYNATRRGGIETMPDTPGLAVWKAGHIGVYIGNGEVIEAMGTKYGVVKTQLQGRGWTHWLEVPGIEYE